MVAISVILANLEKGDIKIVRAVYSLQSGKVTTTSIALMIQLTEAPLHPQKWYGGSVFLFFICFAVLGRAHVYGQNDGLVFTPEVIAGQALIDARAAYNADDETWVYRNHIQYSFSDSFNLRGVVQYRIDSSNRWDFRYVRFEGLWQFLEDETAGWDSALRFELEIAEGDDLPSRVRLAWSGSFDINECLQVRGNVLTGYRIGPDSEPGVLLEVRAQVNRRITRKVRVALDYFGNMNDTETLVNWESQRHQIGPTLGIKLSKNVQVGGGVLFGISPAAANHEYRAIVMRTF